MKKFFTLSFPKPKKQQTTLSLPTQGPRQSTLDAIMAFASQYNCLEKA